MATINSNGTGGGNSSFNSTWSGLVHPAYGDKVVIEDGDTVTLDEDFECGTGVYPSDSTPYDNAGWSLQLKGTLKVSHTVDSSLSVDGLINYYRTSGTGHSTLDFEDIPETINFTWYLNPRGNMTSRGYYYACSLYANSESRTPKVKISSAYHRRRNTFIIGEVSAGATTFTVDDATGWKAGDELLIAPRFTATNQYNSNHEYDEVIIASVSGNDITITTGLTYNHGYADTEDYPAAAVSNKTSNVKIMGYDDATYCPAMYILRADFKMKDVVGDFLNNGYSLNADIFRIAHLGIYSSLEATIESCFFQADGTNLNYYLYGILYTNSVYDTYGIIEVKDIALNTKPRSNRYSYYGMDQFYTGRAIKITDCNVYCSQRYNNSAQFNDYQQPATYTNCKSFNSQYGFSLHDNALTKAIGCWSIGSRFSTGHYNGTAKFIDHHFRFVEYLGYPYGGWIGFAEYERPDFDANHLAQTDPQSYLYTATNPDGCMWHLSDIQNDTSKQRWFYSYGQKWWEFTETRNDSYSIGMKSTSNTYAVPHERTFAVSTGDAVNVGLFVKNLSASYIGILTITVLQGSEVIITKDFDLTTLTADEWTYLSTGGVATKTMTTTFRIEYKGSGGEIAITDFVQPFTASEKSQAKAVWAELLAENKVAGSFGEAVGEINENTELIPPLLSKK